MTAAGSMTATGRPRITPRPPRGCHQQAPDYIHDRGVVTRVPHVDAVCRCRMSMMRLSPASPRKAA